MTENIKNLPEINFIDDETVSDIQKELVAAYEEKYALLTNKDTYTLPKASQMRILINATALLLYQALQYIDRAGKQGMLKYSYGDYLDNLAALKGITRKPAQAASVVVRFELEEVRESATAIPAGTRVSSGDDVYFETKEYTEIPAGSIAVDCKMSCLTAGTAGNGYEIGEISILVDPILYISKVSNTDISSGGTEIESDDDFKERIYLAPSAYSTAGTVEAYDYYVRNFSSLINDVSITTDESTAIVKIFIMLKDEKLPTDEFMTELKEYISSDEVKPLTDKIEVYKPTLVDYGINLEYYIAESDKKRATDIQKAVTEAVEKYQMWQSDKIGRDINPDKLKEYIMAAGAKRVKIQTPIYKILKETEIATILSAGEKELTLNYENGGIDHNAGVYSDTSEPSAWRTPASNPIDISNFASCTITANNELIQNYKVTIWFCDNTGVKAENNINNYHKIELSKTFTSAEYKSDKLAKYMRLEIKARTISYAESDAIKVIESIKGYGTNIINYGGIEDD